MNKHQHRAIEVNPKRPGPEGARIAGHGIPVWLIISHLIVTGGNKVRVAEDFDVPLALVKAALEFYREHTAALNARIAEARRSLQASEYRGA